MSDDGWLESSEGDLDPDLTEEAGYGEWDPPRRGWMLPVWRVLAVLLLIALLGGTLMVVLRSSTSPQPPQRLPQQQGSRTRLVPGASFPEPGREHPEGEYGRLLLAVAAGDTGDTRVLGRTEARGTAHSAVPGLQRALLLPTLVLPALPLAERRMDDRLG